MGAFPGAGRRGSGGGLSRRCGKAGQAPEQAGAAHGAGHALVQAVPFRLNPVGLPNMPL